MYIVMPGCIREGTLNIVEEIMVAVTEQTLINFLRPQARPAARERLVRI